MNCKYCNNTIMNEQKTSMQNEDIIRYDVGGRPTFFTVLETLVKITEDTKTPLLQQRGPGKRKVIGMNYINKQIRCPATGETKTVRIEYTFLDGKPFPFPCNGCEDANGTKPCEKCAADVTLEFYHNPPDLSLFADPLQS